MSKKKPMFGMEIRVDGRTVSPDEFGNVMRPHLKRLESIRSLEGEPFRVSLQEAEFGDRDEEVCRLLRFERGDATYTVRVAMQGALAATLRQDRSRGEVVALAERVYTTEVAREIALGSFEPGVVGSMYFYRDGTDARADEVSVLCPGGRFPPDG